MKLLAFFITCSLLFSCENNSDTSQDKIRKLLQDYAYARLVGGARNILGHPLCGGDPIGYMLGWNWDVQVPIDLEVGQTYQFEGNPNATTTDFNYKEGNVNIFRVSNSSSTKNTIYRITLLNDCSADLAVFLSKCSGTAYEGISFGNYKCTVNNANEYNNLEKKDSYEECIIKKDIQDYFILVYKNECQYSIVVNQED